MEYLFSLSLSIQEGFSFMLIFSAVSVTLGGSLLGGFNTAVLSVPSRVGPDMAIHQFTVVCAILNKASDLEVMYLCVN